MIGGSPTLFSLGRGTTTLPDPAMVRRGRADLNSNKTKIKLSGSLPLLPKLIRMGSDELISEFILSFETVTEAEKDEIGR